MRLLFVTTLLAIVALPGVASVQGKDGDERAGATAEPAPVRNRIVCRSERVTGSHFRQRICRTQSQIEADQEAARELLRETIKNSADRVPQ